jgi:hypothetical protein
MGILSRASYCTYLIHFSVLFVFMAAILPPDPSPSAVVLAVLAGVATSFLAGAYLSVLWEIPCASLFGACMNKRNGSGSETYNHSESGSETYNQYNEVGKVSEELLSMQPQGCHLAVLTGDHQSSSFEATARA